MKEKIFVDGMKFENPPATAPSFVKGRISIKADALIAFCQKHQNEKGWLNVDLKESKGGVMYFELNTYKKVEQTANPEQVPVIAYPEEDVNPADTPF